MRLTSVPFEIVSILRLLPPCIEFTLILNRYLRDAGRSCNRKFRQGSLRYKLMAVVIDALNQSPRNFVINCRCPRELGVGGEWLSQFEIIRVTYLHTSQQFVKII